jgi:hypothetical protein
LRLSRRRQDAWQNFGYCWQQLRGEWCEGREKWKCAKRISEPIIDNLRVAKAGRRTVSTVNLLVGNRPEMTELIAENHWAIPVFKRLCTFVSIARAAPNPSGGSLSRRARSIFP